MCYKKTLLSILIVTGLCITPYENVFGDQRSLLKVHIIDVGQGDSILIQTPSNKIVLIDGGPPVAGKKVVDYLEKRNIDSIDLLIATHPDMDHIGGLPDVMNSVKVKQVIDSGKFYFTRAYRKYIRNIRKQKIPLKIAELNEKIDIDPSVNIKILNTYERFKNNNESSIVVKITFGEIDFLLLGDIEREQEKELVEKFDVAADIVKVAHHGSKTSSSLNFLQRVNPDVALLTYSKQNNFGHPVPQVISHLNHIRAQIYSTAVYGNILIYTNGASYIIDPEKDPIDGLLDKTG